MRLYNVNENVILEGQIATIIAVHEKNSTVDIKVGERQYTNVPNSLIVAKRLPALYKDMQLGKEDEVTLLNGTYKYKVVGYRTKYDFDIEITKTLQQETGEFVDFGVFTGERIYGVSEDTLSRILLVDYSKDSNRYTRVKDTKYMVLPNGDDFEYSVVDGYCYGNFKELPRYNKVYIPVPCIEFGNTERKSISYFIKGCVYDKDSIVVSTDENKTVLKTSSGTLSTYNTEDLWYGGISRSCKTEDYEDGRYHYRDLRVMLKNGKFGYIKYVFNDGKYLIQLDNKKFVEETEFYIGDGTLNIGDIYYSTGGDVLTVLDNKGTLMSFTGQYYTQQDYKDILGGKVGKKLYDYTGDTLRNRIGQEMEITGYNGDSRVNVKFASGEERKNLQMYSILKGIVLDGNFEYNAEKDCVLCGNYENPMILDYDSVYKTYIVKAGNRYGTTDYIKSLGIKNTDYKKEELTVNIGDSYLQSCFLNAKVIGGWDDNNLTVQLQNGIRIYNVSRKDLEEGVLGVGNNSQALEMLDIYKLYKQKNGCLCQIVAKFEDICDVLVYSSKTVEVKTRVRLEDVYNGLVGAELKQGTTYTNKLGMKYTVKLIKDSKAYISFDDGKSTAIVDKSSCELSVLPDYFDCDNIGYITDIKFDGLEVVDELLPEFNNYKFTGKCSKCNEIVTGDVITLKGHKCNK